MHIMQMFIKCGGKACFSQEVNCLIIGRFTDKTSGKIRSQKKRFCLCIAIFQRHHTKDAYRYNKLSYPAEIAVPISSKSVVQNGLLHLLQKDYFFP